MKCAGYKGDQLGASPESVAGFIIKYQEIEDDDNTGAEIGQGWEEVKFSDTEVSRWDEDDQQIVFESYTYSKTGPSTGTLIISNANEQYTLNLSFNANMHGVGSGSRPMTKGHSQVAWNLNYYTTAPKTIMMMNLLRLKR